MYIYILFTLSKKRPLTYIVFFMYMHILELSLAITNFLKKNSLVISSIMRRAIRPKGTKGPITELVTELAIVLETRLVMGPRIRLAIKPRIKLARGPATKPESVERFLTDSTTGFVNIKELSLS